jgi:hypothetical protein
VQPKKYQKEGKGLSRSCDAQKLGLIISLNAACMLATHKARIALKGSG